MRRSKLYFVLLIGMCATMLVGCNKNKDDVAMQPVIEEEKNMFGLTASEQKMYAQYAAGTLMKYSAGSNMRILEGQVLINREAKEKAERERAEKRAQLAAEYEAEKKEKEKKNKDKDSGNGTTTSSEGSEISYISDMSQATGTDAFSIIYDGYEITDSYPNSGDDLFMAMDATTGKLLMVTKYKVTNISGQTENFNMFSKQGKFRLDLNGKRYNSQYTLLLNDLSMYKGDIAAGETIEGVLIFEIPEAEAPNVNDMVLSVTVDGETSSMQLQGGSTVMWTETAKEIADDVEGIEEMQPEQEISEEEPQDSDHNSLAEEYMEAIEAENAGGNVTVIGSNSN